VVHTRYYFNYFTFLLFPVVRNVKIPLVITYFLAGEFRLQPALSSNHAYVNTGICSDQLIRMAAGHITENALLDWGSYHIQLLIELGTQGGSVVSEIALKTSRYM